MDGSVVGKGEGREEIGWNGMGARSQKEERVWVVRERGADIFFCFSAWDLLVPCSSSH